MSLYILSALCLILLAALSWALSELYSKWRDEGGEFLEAPGRAPVEQAEEIFSMLSSLHEYGVSSEGEAHRGEFGEFFLEKACRIAGSSRGTLMLYDEEAGELSIVAARNLPRYETPLKLKPGEGLAGRAIETGRPIFLPEPGADPRFLAGSEAPPSEPVLSVPLMIQGKALGVLNIHDTAKVLAPDDGALKSLSLLAREAAAVLDHQARYEFLDGFYLEMARAVAGALDARDGYAPERCGRAASSARAVAEALGLTSRVARYASYAAMLSGIGKIAVEDSILSKPGELSADELKRVRKYPGAGFRILSPVKFLGPAAHMVLYHREWFDGRGYPDRLKGEEIPLGGRILCVVSAWEAMASDRPYRSALSEEAAIGEMKAGSGTQFDPNVVEAFLRCRERLRDGGG
jgi:HD-GYP domain-containing protein (c-di-GMP phosphodiesterase class II)